VSISRSLNRAPVRPVGLFGSVHRRIRRPWIGPSKLWLEEPTFPCANMRARTVLSCSILTVASIDVNDRLEFVGRQVWLGHGRAIHKDNWRPDSSYPPFAPAAAGFTLRLTAGCAFPRTFAENAKRWSSAPALCVDTPIDAGGFGPRNRPAQRYRSSAIEMCVAQQTPLRHALSMNLAPQTR
jgi:hypothetical protein